MWIGGSSKIARTAEVLLRVQAGLFGSGSAGLGHVATAFLLTM